MRNQRRTLSSALTIFFKVIAPILMLAASGLSLSWWLWLALQEDLRLRTITLIPLSALLVVIGFYLFGFRLKKVAVDDHRLYVSNYLREISIPLAEIESVSESWLTNPKLVYIRLKAQSPFGRKIVFAPPLRALSQFRHHPVVDELKRMILSDKRRAG
jgi:hypothetical protein